jgi:hypothetical protein
MDVVSGRPVFPKVQDVVMEIVKIGGSAPSSGEHSIDLRVGGYGRPEYVLILVRSVFRLIFVKVLLR